MTLAPLHLPSISSQGFTRAPGLQRRKWLVWLAFTFLGRGTTHQPKAPGRGKTWRSRVIGDRSHCTVYSGPTTSTTHDTPPVSPFPLRTFPSGRNQRAVAPQMQHFERPFFAPNATSSGARTHCRPSGPSTAHRPTAVAPNATTTDRGGAATSFPRICAPATSLKWVPNVLWWSFRAVLRCVTVRAKPDAVAGGSPEPGARGVTPSVRSKSRDRRKYLLYFVPPLPPLQPHPSPSTGGGARRCRQASSGWSVTPPGLTTA
ncbi:hypothetical protein EDB80DRAFT_819540 [Ilyonectria destructans]|nr:hypothetical protein EDB80DRAFT_819540 [Ilyonectria destructans]